MAASLQNRTNRSSLPQCSSVTGERGAEGGMKPPHWPAHQMQNKENITFLALLKLSFALE